MAAPARKGLVCTALRRMDYAQAFRRQVELRDRCIAGTDNRGYLLLIEHPPTITIGRSGTRAEVRADEAALAERGVTVVETNRGGRVTFHGPGQLVMYPIIDLRSRGPDLHRYLDDLQSWLVRVCRSYGVPAHAHGPHTGVWVEQRKIASIGIAVRRWITSHGVALNVRTDLSQFDLIVPCGLQDATITSLEQESDARPDLHDVAERASRYFAEDFDMELVRAGGETVEAR